MSQEPENKAEVVKAPKPATKPAKPAAKPVDLEAFAVKDDEAKKPVEQTLAAPIRCKVNFNDAEWVIARPLGDGENVKLDIRRAPDGRRFVVVPAGYAAELRTATRIDAIEFEWRIVPPTIEGVIVIDVNTWNGIVHVDARPVGGTPSTVFEGDEIVELY